MYLNFNIGHALVNMITISRIIIQYKMIKALNS